MNHEKDIQPAFRIPYEVFGLTKKEQLNWRVNQARFEEILNDDQTIIHEIKDSTNNYGEFTFVTTSRPGDQGRISITFYGLGYHEYRELWIVFQRLMNAAKRPVRIRMRRVWELE